MHGKHTEKYRDEQAENDAFVRMVHGVKRADRMQLIWGNSYPQFGKSKEEVFRENAIREGFTGKQVNRFLDLP
jgi:hypothetical protein